jgi:ABC-type multidrug transport system fused ATPase/permease subunit
MGSGVIVGDQLIQLMVTLPSALIIGFAVLMIVYRMIDAIIPAAVGFTIIVLLLVVLYFCVWPPHPAVPFIALVSVVAGMVSFPFIESYLNKIAMEEMDVDYLEKALASWHARPDNIASQLMLAAALHKQGFRHHAIAMGNDAINRASSQVDNVKNTSIRDMFRKEEYYLRQWEQETTPAPREVSCMGCGHLNPATTVFCLKCQQPHILHRARSTNPRTSVFGRLALTFALICLAIVGGCGVGLAFDGAIKWIAFTSMFVIVGGCIWFLLRTRYATDRSVKVA